MKKVLNDIKNWLTYRYMEISIITNLILFATMRLHLHKPLLSISWAAAILFQICISDLGYRILVSKKRPQGTIAVIGKCIALAFFELLSAMAMFICSFTWP